MQPPTHDDKVIQFSEEMASDSVQPISDSSSRSDWFRQTVLFWSSQNTNCDGTSEHACDVNDKCSHGMISDLSSTGSTCSLSPDLSSLQRCDSKLHEGELIDLDFTTSELLKQVEEFEYCFSELTKQDNNARIKNENRQITGLIGEDGYSSSGTGTTETRSPHLTLEFPVGSSIRDSPLYKTGDTKKLELGNNMECTANCTADDGNSRKVSMDEECSSCNGIESQGLLKACQSQGDFEKNEDMCKQMVTDCVDITDSIVTADMNDDDRGDPNDVMRDLLSGIRPPERISICTTPSPSPRQSASSPKSLQQLQGVDIAPELPAKENKLSKLNIRNGSETIPELPVKENKINNIRLKDDVFLPESKSTIEVQNDVLLKQIDTLIELEHQASRPIEARSLQRKPLKNNHEILERLDSGLNGMSSDSNSPYPSPMVQRCVENLRNSKSPGYDSGYVEPTIRSATETIFESSKEHGEWDFPEDSDMSSDWSPLSTMDSADFSVTSSKRSRSYSVPHSANFTTPTYHNRKTSADNMKKRANTSALSYHQKHDSPADVVYSETELSAIRKFLTLTRKYFDKGAVTISGVKESAGACLDELAMLPNMKEIIDAQNKEVREQRELMEGFIRQLGELLIEIVNLKDEQCAVRTKQAKALTLLKKQLDHHKKNQSQTCTEILEQVNILNDKLNTTLSSEQLCSTPTSKRGSTKSVTSTKSLSSSTGKPALQHSKSVPSPASTPFSTTTSPALQPAQCTSNYGHIIWKIPDVMRKITKIKSGNIDGTLVSTPFQTGEYQYNMNAWVYLNGRGKMVGKFVSVYACVLVGEYDAILSWPVTPTYKFTLIDQRSDPTKRQDHVRYRRVLDIAGRGENVISQNGGIPRPTDGSKALIVGLDDFIAHDQLLKNRYLVDDVIFLKVEAEIN